jgi:hypothetical protein
MLLVSIVKRNLRYITDVLSCLMPPADSCMFIFGINFGPHLGHIWATFGPHLGHIWATFGPHLGHIWATFGPNCGLRRQKKRPKLTFKSWVNTHIYVGMWVIKVWSGSHRSMVVYMCSSLLQLATGSRDLSQAEKRISVKLSKFTK